MAILSRYKCTETAHPILGRGSIPAILKKCSRPAPHCHAQRKLCTPTRRVLSCSPKSDIHLVIVLTSLLPPKLAIAHQKTTQSSGQHTASPTPPVSLVPRTTVHPAQSLQCSILLYLRVVSYLQCPLVQRICTLFRSELAGFHVT